MTMLRCADMLNLTHPAHRLCLLPDYSWAKQGRVTRPGGDLRQVVIPGCASWRRPGIHTPDRGYGFRARSRCSRPGMTGRCCRTNRQIESAAMSKGLIDLI